MILKAVSFFLIIMIVLAMFGKLRMPKISLRRAKTCEKCGRHLIGKGPCECKKK